MSAEQVLTRFDDHLSEIAAPDQEPRQTGGTPPNVIASLVVRASPPNPPNIRSERASLLKAAGDRLGGQKSAKLQLPKKRRGGWPPTRWLAWDDVKEIVSIIHELTRLGFAPTHLITIMPHEGNDSDRKRFCTRETAHLGQALKRHSAVHVGITIFENSATADLHAHHLVHVPRGERATVERRHRPPEVHVRRIRTLEAVLRYLTKERRHLSPDFEERIRRRWQRCRPVPGKKWTMTRKAKELLGGGEPYGYGEAPKRPLPPIHSETGRKQWGRHQ
jgi:hypothetical protein